MTPKENYLKQFVGQPDITVLDETLQKEADPIAVLKAIKSRAVIVVPAEYVWPSQLNPLKNPLHKRVYDAELLAKHLEEANLTYAMRLLVAGQWSWLVVEASR